MDSPTSEDLASVVHAAIAPMIGHQVEADVITGGGHHRMAGPAAWSAKRPNCGSRFLSIDDSGIPIPSRGLTDVEVFDAGVRWKHPIMLVTLRCPQLTGYAS